MITNHLGEPRKTLQGLEGIRVRDLLELKEDNPKLFSEFYFTFKAADDYKVVFSSNELFNSPTGDQVFIITSRDGKKLEEMEDRILVISSSDFKTGRRHLKFLN